MSRGLGIIQIGIVEVLADEPDNAFLVEEMCERIYRTKNITRAQCVAVRRAGKSIVKISRSIRIRDKSGARGGPVAFYNLESMMSFAMARLKTDSLENYLGIGWGGVRNAKPGKRGFYRTEEQLRARLLGEYHHCIVPGGAWWRHREMELAERDGDAARLAELEKEQATDIASLAEMFSNIGKK
jgi:hypothetical protein